MHNKLCETVDKNVYNFLIIYMMRRKFLYFVFAGLVNLVILVLEQMIEQVEL